jgi:tRNA modification GTPase
MTISRGDTIVAISTPRGFSGIGVIRMSGPRAVDLLRDIFRRAGGAESFPDRMALYGHVIDPDTNEVIDDGMALVMRGPHSYTGEDMAELSLHGSPLILDTTRRILVELGARPARRGEFTQRAFLSGRLDLLQAEAIIEIIESTSRAGLKEARSALDHKVSLRVKQLSDSLKDLLADLEASLDFDEDDERPAPETAGPLTRIAKEMEEILKASHRARPIKEGIRTVIIGKPNVGKSTLFNALAQDERAIVTPYPGTTRDAIEDYLRVGPASLLITDTAGVRVDPAPIEAEGITRTLRKIEDSDMALAVFDAQSKLDMEDQELLEMIRDKVSIAVINKMDQCASEPSPELPGWLAPNRIARISALTGEGMERLMEIITDCAQSFLNPDEEFESRTSLNQRAALLMESALGYVREPLEQVRSGRAPEPELVAYSVGKALESLEEITGERVEQGILERVFERFCVGK